jgi:hypothetical protein
LIEADVELAAVLAAVEFEPFFQRSDRQN